MNWKFYCFLFFAALPFTAFNQPPEVPARIKFADIQLKISEDARASIQKDVDMLTKSPKYHEIKAERARTYFPIIEKIFEEEGVPLEFKYLAIQESALIPDAVSTSQAVGFWQLKDFTAMELGLRVDRQIDERLNIVSSSYAAARYFKKANAVFDNWLHSLQSYQMGIGGATEALGESEIGKKHMTINAKTYWYVKKFLAHMIAFQNVYDKPTQRPVSEFIHGSGKSLHDISRETGKDFEQIKELNKWLLKGNIPPDRPYVVLLPGDFSAIQDRISTIEANSDLSKETSPLHRKISFPEIIDSRFKKHKYIIGVNGLPGIIASNTDNAFSLAQKGEISESRFLEYNDLSPKTAIIPGQVYYFKRKKRKANTHYHTVQPGETLWDISQKYGIRMDQVISKNRITSSSEFKEGRVLWLRYIRPKDIAPEYKETNTPAPVITIAKNIPDDAPNSGNSTLETTLEQTTPETTEIDNINSTDSKLFQNNSVIAKVEEINKEEKNEIEDEESHVIVYSTSGKAQKTHTVVKGETFYSISTRYGIPVPALLQWNELEITDKIYIGQKLIVFVNETKNSIKVHKVAPGDTMYGISSKYNVSVDQILKWNNKTDYTLKVGEEIKIYD